MFNNNDEHDEDHDKDEDADFENPSDEDQDDEDDDNDDEDEDSDDASDDEEEDDDKPVTLKELKELLKGNQNKNNANRRISSKGKPAINKAPKTEDRLAEIEKRQQRADLLERKREFGYNNSLSPKQVDLVFRLSKRPTSKFLKEPYVQAAIKSIGETANVRENTPGGSGRAFKSQGNKSWDKLSDQEKQDNFADRRRAILNSKKG